MPPRIPAGNSYYRSVMSDTYKSLGSTDIEYDYPQGAPAMKPGSPFHSMVVTRLNEYIEDSRSELSRHYNKWSEMDDIMTAFIPWDDHEKKIREKDKRKPIAIVMPLTYAVFKSIQTQYLATLTLGDELHRLQAASPEDAIGAMLMEKHLLAQSRFYKELQARSVQMMDFLKYGMGAVTPVWDRKLGYRTTNINGTSQRTQEVTFEGNRVRNIDMRRLHKDPSVSAYDVQDGEFVGYSCIESIMKLLSREANEPGWFNAKYVLEAANQGGLLDPDSLEAMAGGGEGVGRRRANIGGDISTRPIHVDVIYATIIPSEWRTDEGGKTEVLAPVDVPLKWVFVMAGKSILLFSGPLGLDHDTYPIYVAAPESDGYSASAMGLLEITRGLQQCADFEWNSHAAFVRKMLRGWFFGDPMRVDVEALLRGDAFVGVERIGYNQNIGDVLQQIQTVDPTRQNLPDIQFLQDFMQRATGATDPMQGIMQAKGERRSAEEARGARMGALSRIQQMVLQEFQQSGCDLTRAMASQTRQFVSQESWIRTLGRWEEELRAEYMMRQMAQRPGYAAPYGGMFPVGPADLDVNVDIAPIDATRQGEASVETWVQLYSTIIGNPVLAQQIDVLRVFKHIARLAGARNVSDFIIQNPGMMQPQIQVMPDQQVQQQMQAGNLAPVTDGPEMSDGLFA